MGTESNRLPQTFPQWRKEAQPRGCHNISIHDFPEPKSGSRITIEQFLTLRILWQDKENNCLAGFLKAINIDGTRFKTERKAMNQDSSWKTYLMAVKERSHKSNSTFEKELGSFGLVYKHQLQAQNLPDKPESDDVDKVIVSKIHPIRQASLQHGTANPSWVLKDSGNPKNRSILSSPGGGTAFGSDPFEDTMNTLILEAPSPPRDQDLPCEPPSQDEQIVNTACVNFLDALSIFDDRHADWSLHRKSFRFRSKTGVTFQARTDGHLRRHGGNRSDAIIEVKARSRYYSSTKSQIDMQQSAQMALWIFCEPNSHWLARPSAAVGQKYCRILISQDRNELYITIAEYTKNYVHYLKKPGEGLAKTASNETPFLTMTCYGPFVTCDHEHMEAFGASVRLLVAHATSSEATSPYNMPQSSRASPKPEDCAAQTVFNERKAQMTSDTRLIPVGAPANPPPVQLRTKSPSPAGIARATASPPRRTGPITRSRIRIVDEQARNVKATSQRTEESGKECSPASFGISTDPNIVRPVQAPPVSTLFTRHENRQPGALQNLSGLGRPVRKENARKHAFRSRTPLPAPGPVSKSIQLAGAAQAAPAAHVTPAAQTLQRGLKIPVPSSQKGTGAGSNLTSGGDGAAQRRRAKDHSRGRRSDEEEAE